MDKASIFMRKGAIAGLVCGAILLLLGAVGPLPYRVGLLLLLFSGALAVMGHRSLRRYAFTAWVLVCVGVALAYPQFLQEWGGFSLPLLIVPLVQLVLFGMGTTLSPADFSRILKAPWAVLLGVSLQFGIMPVVGFIVATSFGFEGELAAGIVLIGSVSGGVASNLMAFIAGANVALSVTMTVVSTFAAPLLTPVLMQTFSGRFIPIDTFAMMIGVLNIIIVPVIAGLLAHSVLYSPKRWSKQVGSLVAVVMVSAMVILVALLVAPAMLGIWAPLRKGVILGGALIAIVAVSKLIVSVWLGRPNTWMDRILPLISMAGICITLAIIIAQTHDVLMETGILLVLAAVIHNAAGYGLGYWGARTVGLSVGWLGHKLGFCEKGEAVIDESSCRTVAFEVGMQNGGLATGLAMDVLKSHIAALAPNVFGTWMNISGSILANWWKRRQGEKNRKEGPGLADLGAQKNLKRAHT